MCICVFEIGTSLTSLVCRLGLWGLILRFVDVLMQIQNSFFFFFLDKNICPIFRAFWDLLFLYFTLNYLSSLQFCSQYNVCGGFLHHQAFSDTCCVSYKITQFWLYLPGGSIRSHRLRAQSPTPSFRCYASDWLSVIPLPGSCSFVSSSRTQRNILLAEFQKQSGGRGVKGKVWGEGSEFHALLECNRLCKSPDVHRPRSTLNPIFLGDIRKASLLRHAWLYHWPLAVDSTSNLSPWRSGMGWKFPTLQSHSWFP